MIWRVPVVLAVLLLLQSCAEGGIGGTGSVRDDPPPLIIGMDGQGNKGPYAAGSTVVTRTLSGVAESSSLSSGSFGEFSVMLPEGEARIVEISGTYFSELAGEVTSVGVTLSGIVIGNEDAMANVNVATHLVHERIMRLIDSGESAAAATEMARSELLLALSGVLPAPANPVRFSSLAVINAAQSGVNSEGNAWLLALSALLEQEALRRGTMNGTSADAELVMMLDELASGLADDGAIDNEVIDDLIQARGQLNPDRIHGHLLAVDQSRQVEALVASGQLQSDAQSLNCRAFGSRILCAHEAETINLVPFSAAFEPDAEFDLESVVADMNRFIDSDGDGTVNRDDDDDDNDGIPDAEDGSPYGV